MLPLRDLQGAFREALVAGDAAAALPVILPDRLAPRARLRIYQNHVLITLTEALKAIYPVVCRLVDERFFAYACAAYIRERPPTAPCLFEYGESFAEFLAAFEPCRDLPYLPDVARLEWVLNAALHAEDAEALDPERLRALRAEDYPRLRFDFHPSYRLLASPFPIDRIWRANQPDAGDGAPVRLDAGAVCLEVRRLADDVMFRPLDAATFALRRALCEGAPLDAAASAALALEPGSDLVTALQALLREGAVTGFALSPPRSEGDGR